MDAAREDVWNASVHKYADDDAAVVAALDDITARGAARHARAIVYRDAKPTPTTRADVRLRTPMSDDDDQHAKTRASGDRAAALRAWSGDRPSRVEVRGARGLCRTVTSSSSSSSWKSSDRIVERPTPDVCCCCTEKNGPTSRSCCATRGTSTRPTSVSRCATRT